RATIIFSMWSIIPYFVYLASLCFVTGRSFPLDGGRHLR
ncbi:GlpM family protein, partial [Escherichia coli]|nr:GlpM family protein [Escherichia coli]